MAVGAQPSVSTQKRLTTCSAFFLRFTFVCFHVCSEVTGEGEFFMTEITPVRFITCMEEEVVLEVGVLRKAPAADVAPERPRPVVHVHVRLEVARGRKRLGTQRTLVRLFLDVGHPVVVQIRAGSEPFSAHLALVGFFSRVDPPVRVQRAARAESLVAHRTNMRFFSCVRSHVSLEEGGPVESLAADLAGQECPFRPRCPRFWRDLSPHDVVDFPADGRVAAHGFPFVRVARGRGTGRADQSPR